MNNEKGIELLKKHKLTDATLSLLINSKEYNYVQLLKRLMFLKYIDKEGFLTPIGKDIIEEFNNYSTEESMVNLADTIRNMYPAGIKPGTNKSWRGTEKEVVRKLYSIMKQHPDITKEEIISAVNYYLNTGESSYRRTLPYFIEKHGESDMYTYILTAREAKKASINMLLEGNDNDDDEKGRWLW